MALSATPYPKGGISVATFAGTLAPFIAQPVGLLEGWPLPQAQYLGSYLTELDCKTIVVESHYIDRDYIEDVALFYAKSLRSYPNYCSRLHCFRESFDLAAFQGLIAKGDAAIESSEQWLQASYLGYIVIRPLPAYPIGRTVLRSYPRQGAGFERDFATLRPYEAHLCGFKLSVSGLAFLQQDQGVSACATTAVWSAINGVSHREGSRVATPAEITQLASKYLLLAGRSLPSEGLGLQQICEAVRGADLSPLVLRSATPEDDKPSLFTYMQSGFAPILGLGYGGMNEGHAICAVGMKLGDIQPSSDPNIHFLDSATRLKSLYVHDDRLGPYALADLFPYTLQGASSPRTGVQIKWPGDGADYEHGLLTNIIVPIPTKLRLSATRLRKVGLHIAEIAALFLAPFVKARVCLNCRYVLSTEYKRRAFKFGLSPDGLHSLVCDLVLSRYVGLIEISTPDASLFDVLIDVTETDANPSVLAIVLREQKEPEVRKLVVQLIKSLAGTAIL